MRSPPVLAMKTSLPAPPKARSSHDGLVSAVWLRPQFVVMVLLGPQGESRLSSRLSRSSPQPPYILSRPVPPTSQSWPRSPNIVSLPSVGTAVYLVWPRIHCASSGPSEALKLSSQLYPVEGSVGHPDGTVPLKSEPSQLSMTFRSGSLASYSWNLVVDGL